MNSIKTAALTIAIGVALTGCDSTSPNSDPQPLNASIASDIEADPTTGRDPNTGAPISNNLFTLYDLDSGTVVVSSSETNKTSREADSVSTTWDIGLKGTTLIFNGGTSGPGQGSAQLLTEIFADVTEAPETGYFADGENPNCPAVETPGGTFPGTPYAICTGSGSGWYDYNSSTNLVLPIAGRTIVMKTGEGNYAKIRILSYYQGNPNPPDANAPTRYFTFEYIVQPDGSRNFETTTVE